LLAVVTYFAVLVKTFSVLFIKNKGSLYPFILYANLSTAMSCGIFTLVLMVCMPSTEIDHQL